MEQFVAAWRYDVVFCGGAWPVENVWFGRRTILARTNVQAHGLSWPDDVGSTTGYLCFVESRCLRSVGLVCFVRGLARVGLTYVGLFRCVRIVFHFR